MSGVRDEVDRQIISIRPEPMPVVAVDGNEDGTATVVAV
jgi:hypothetical protein